MNRQFTINDVFMPGITGGEPDRVRKAFHAPDLLSGAEVGQRDSAAEQLGMSYGEVDAGWDDASTELKIRKAETVPGADKWVQDAPENVTFLEEDADGLMAVYQSLQDSGFLSQDDLDEGTAQEIAQGGNGIADTLERARLANERTDIGAAVLSGAMAPEEARAKLSSIDNRMAALAKRRGDVSGFYSFMEQGYRMATRDLPHAGRRALEGGLTGASAGAIAGTIAGSAVPVVGNLTGAVGGSVAGGIAGVGAGLARGMYESAQHMEEANFLADLLNEKDDAGNYLDVDEIREKAQLYGMGSALVELAGDALSVGATKLIAPVLKVAAANIGSKGLKLFAKDAIANAVQNKQSWPVLKRFALGLGAGFAAEGTEEGVQEGVSIAVENWLKNSLNEEGKAYYRDRQEYFTMDNFAAMGESALEGGKVGMWFVLLPGIAQLFVDAGKVSRARDFAKGVKDVGAVVANSSTAQMAPARMDTFLQANGLNQTVYIPADAAWQMQTQGTDLVAALGWTQESLEEAASLGHDIAVPLSRLVSRLDSGTLNAVADIMREGPQAMNVFEAEDPNSFLQADVDAISAAAEEWEFEQDMLDAELDRVRTAITEAVRSVPGLLNQIVGSVDPETSVSTYVDTIMTIIEQAAQRLRVYGDDVGSIIQKLNFEGLIRGADGRLHTAEEIEQMVAEEAQAEADRPFWDNVWGRLDADSLKRDFPEARRELAQKHGYGLFSRKGEGLAVDELADILKNAGWLEQDADSSTLVEMLKSKKRPKARKAVKADPALRQNMAANSHGVPMDRVTVLTGEVTAQELDEALSALAGQDLPNLIEGITAQVNANQKRKLESSVSANKSMNNGFTRGEHRGLAAQIAHAWQWAAEARRGGDTKNGMPDVAIRRFVSALQVNGQDVFAWLTVKETPTGLRIYSAELMDEIKLRDIVGSGTAEADTDTLHRSFEEIIERLNRPVNDESTLYQFIGESGAARLDRQDKALQMLDRLAVARSMEKNGESPARIKLAVGWERGADGLWRYELDDSEAEYRKYGDARLLSDSEYQRKEELWKQIEASFYGGPDVDESVYEEFDAINEKWSEAAQARRERVEAGQGLLSDILYHPTLFKAYPRLADIPVTFEDISAEGQTVFIPQTLGKPRVQKIVIREGRRQYASDDQLLSILMHEVQHVIQNAEDFAMGGSTGEMSFADYRVLAGEVEARNTQKRLSMSAEEREESLAAETEDVAREDQLIIWDGLAAYSEAPLEQRAWHGAPRDFDRFDFSYMGTGEGHQVHGWGGYVAASKEISDRRYRERFAKGVKILANGERIDEDMQKLLEAIISGSVLFEAMESGDFTKFREAVRWYIKHYRQPDRYRTELIKMLQEQIDRIDANPKMSIKAFLEGVPSSDTYRFKSIVDTARSLAKQEGRRAGIADVRDRVLAHMEPFAREARQDLENADKLEALDIDNLEVHKNEGQLFELEIPEDEEMLIEGKAFSEQLPAIQEAILKAFGIGEGKTLDALVQEIDHQLSEIRDKERAATNTWEKANLAARYDELRRVQYNIETIYELIGKDIYKTLALYLGSPKAASLALLREGVQGISYIGGIDGQSWVIFDEKKIEIIQKFYAMQADGAQSYQTGAIIPLDNGDWLIRLFRGANLSTLAHEISHAVHLEMERIEREGKGTDALKRDLDTLRRWQAKFDDEAALRAEYDRYYKGLYGVEFDELDAVGKLAVKQRAQREMVARGFELYLREGEAPTPGMEAVFRRMGKWMKRVYQNASQLDVEINDEVRGVFDRWLASEEDIAAAAAANDIHGFTAPLLDSLGLQGADRLELEGMISDALGKASDALRRDRARYRRDHIQQWRDEVEQELANDPVYQARAAMRRTPLDLDAVVDTYGQELADELRVKLPASMKKGGDNPEMLAFDYGFDNAGQMIRAIVNRPGSQERRKELLAQKMQDADAQFAAEDYLFEQEELRQREDKVGEALYRLELNSKTAMGRPVSPSQQDFEDFGSAEKNRWKIAREQLRTLVSNLLDEKEAQAAIQPDSYRRAAAKAMREERKAILAKNWAEAVKQNYLARVNMEAAYQAGKRRDMVNKLRRQAKRFLASATPDTRARFAVFGLSQKVSLFDPTMKMVQNAADKGMDDIRAFLEKMKDEGFYTVDAAIPETLFDGQKQNWQLMDWKDLQPYLEGMAVLMHMERESRKANSEAAKAEWRAEMDGLAASILALNPHRNPHADQKKRLDIVRFLKEVHASHLKAETICLLLDGDQDMGPMWRAIIAPINRAQADRDRRMKKARDDMKRLFGVYEASEWVDIRGKRVTVPSLGRGLTKEQMLVIMLNSGNDSNLERLRGMGYKDNEIREIIDMLDERDVRFVQSVWDYLETFRKESFDLEEKLTGVRPQAIEAKPLQTRFGELRGGYYPVSYDPQESSKPIDTESLGTLTGSMMPAVDHGSMKQRTATGLSAPLKLTLEVVPNHVAKTLHMLAFREPVRQVARVLNDKAVNAAIEATMGVENSKELKSWLHYVAGERPGVNGWSKALSMLRKNSALYSMGAKLTTILTQTTGLLASTAEIGPRWVAAGLVDTYCRQNPFDVYRETAALSPMMENRMRSVDRDLYEMSTGLMAKGSSNKVLDKFVKFQHLQEQYAFLPVGLVQMAFADLPTWRGAYAKALHEGRSQAEAIEYADAIVTRTQTGGADKDLAAVQRGQELGKIMTQFYSYFSTLYQIYARRMTMLKRSGYSREAWARLATLFLLTGVAEPILSALFTFDTPEDDEDWSAWMAKKVFFNPWNMVVGVRDVFGAVESLVDGYGGKSRAASLLNDSIDTGVRFLSQLAKGEDMDPRAALKSGWKGVGLLTGMVNAQELLFLEAFWDWLEDTNPDFEWADLVRRKK